MGPVSYHPASRSLVCSVRESEVRSLDGALLLDIVLRSLVREAGPLTQCTVILANVLRSTLYLTDVSFRDRLNVADARCAF